MRKIDLNGKNKYYTLYKSIRGEILSGRIREDILRFGWN